MQKLSLLQESVISGTFYGKTVENEVIEFRLHPNPVMHTIQLRKWLTFGKNFTFVPKILRKGLAITDGKKLYKLLKNDMEDEIDPGSVAIEKWEEDPEGYPPKSTGENFIDLNVGSKKQKRLIAATCPEDITVRTHTDTIKIYDDLTTGKVFQKITCIKPSNLIVIDFVHNPETLLIFLEDRKQLAIYEYKGIQGFVLRSTMKTNAKSIFKLEVITNGVQKVIIGLVSKNSIQLAEAKMVGNPMVEEPIECTL